MGTMFFRSELFNRPLTPKSFMNVGIYFVALLSGVGVILVGYAAKTDDPVFSIRFLGFLWDSRSELYYRFAVSLFSLAKQLESISNMFSLSVAVLEGIGEVLNNRISIIMTGTGSNLTEINTIERFNFLSLFKDYHPRAGASPGFLASIFYFPFFPFGFLALPFLLQRLRNQ